MPVAHRTAPRLLFTAKLLLGFAAAAFVLSALMLATGWFFRPDLTRRPAMPSAQEAAAAQHARAAQLDPAHPEVIWRHVDYSAGPRAAWWPKGESPLLADLVRAGQLPPVAERVGPEPLVLEGVDGIGRYGGTWNRLATNPNDLEGVLSTRFAYTNLVRWSPEGYPIVPHLAKSWTVSPDKCVWTFTLRRGLRWSDGHPFTTDDILFWWENEVLAFGSEALTDASFMRHTGKLGRIEKIDDLTLRFSFDTPNAMFLEKLASAVDFFRPAHYLRQYHPKLGNQQLIAETMRKLNLPSPYSVYVRMQAKLNPEHPRMWPWIYREYKTSAPQTFVRNPYYFAVDSAGNQLPYLDRLLIDIKSKALISASAAAGEVALQERHIDFEDYTLLASEAAGHGYHLLHWYNASRTALQISPNLNRTVHPHDSESLWKHRLLNEVPFRRALSLAIDRREIIDAVYNGVGEPAQNSPGPSSPFGYAPHFSSNIVYDPPTANALLDSLGLTHRDREGFRTFPDGSRMTWFLNVAESFPPDASYLVADHWARVGVRTIVQISVRTLWQVKQAALEHDFTVWPGLEEFMPMLDPRYYVPMNGASFFAPTWGRWYQRGGMQDAPGSHGPGLEGPPPGHPARRAMELYDLAQTAIDPNVQRAYFRQILEIAANNVWSINIATPPPALVVVKDGFRNVPDRVLAGYFFMTPANAGFETFFWDNPHDSPAALARMQQSLATPPRLPTLDDAPAAQGSLPIAHWIGAALSLTLLLAFLWIAWRHAFVWRRVLTLIPTLLTISVIIFFVVQAPPGDFITSKTMELSLNGDPNAAVQLQDLRKTFRFDEPVWRQYVDWMGFKWFATFAPADAGLLQGNLGRSMADNLPVNEILGDRLALTFVISALTILVTWIIALPIGIYSAVRPYTLGDYGLTLVGFVGMSVPPFLLALVLMYLSGEFLGINVSGLFSLRYAADPAWSWGKVVDLLQHVWVAVIVLGVGSTAVMIRVMRANLLDELKRPYVVAARAKGVRPLRLLLKYPVRIALNPFVSGLAGLFPQLISGGAIVALVLSLPTIGPLLMLALLNEDTYFAASMLMLLSVLGALGTLISDLLLLWLDPRIRFTGGSK